MQSKAQLVRAYQLERRQALLEKRSLPTFAKYRADQARDDHGRFADEGRGAGRATANAHATAIVNIFNTRPPAGGKKPPTPPRRGMDNRTSGGSGSGGSGGGGIEPPNVGFHTEIAPGIHAS